jgi:hypothetical protein
MNKALHSIQEFRESVRRKSQVVFAVLPVCCFVVDFKIAALQHPNTKREP